MKTIFSNLFRVVVCSACLIFNINLSASICYGIQPSSGSAVSIEIIADQAYASSPVPNSSWTTGAFTLCWSNDSGTASISSVTTTSTLPFLADGIAEVAGNQTCQIFAFVGPAVLDLSAGQAVEVLEVEFECPDCTSDLSVLIENSPPNPPVVNGAASIINFFGEEFAGDMDCDLTTQLNFGNSVPASLNAKVLFEGYFNGSGMSTTLNTNGLLPAAQPYNVQPYNYAGAENNNNIGTDIVDWVLVELRDPNNETIVVAQKAGLINLAGSLRSASGTGPIMFDNAPAGDYLVVIHHRGHVSVMSQNLVTLPNTSLDLSQSSNAVKGSNQLKSVNGSFVMRAGDYDRSGTINFSDFILWLQNNNTLSSYLFMDGDGNGTINFTDFILWLSNNNHVDYSGI